MKCLIMQSSVSPVYRQRKEDYSCTQQITTIWCYMKHQCWKGWRSLQYTSLCHLYDDIFLWFWRRSWKLHSPSPIQDVRKVIKNTHLFEDLLFQITSVILTVFITRLWFLLNFYSCVWWADANSDLHNFLWYAYIFPLCKTFILN